MKHLDLLGFCLLFYVGFWITRLAKDFRRFVDLKLRQYEDANRAAQPVGTTKPES